jgi:hypothetical protein
MDAILGLTLIGAIALVLLVSINRQRVAEYRLADHRAAVYKAEAALLAMQAGQPVDAINNGDERLAIVRLPDAAGNANSVWVRATATVRGRSASLVGQVPAGAVRVEQGNSANGENRQ